MTLRSLLGGDTSFQSILLTLLFRENSFWCLGHLVWYLGHPVLVFGALNVARDQTGLTTCKARVSPSIASLTLSIISKSMICEKI